MASRKELSEIRTELAQERTRLAYERTTMANWRTAITIVLFGTTFLGIAESRNFFFYSGIFLIIIGFFFAIVSTLHEFKLQKKL